MVSHPCRNALRFTVLVALLGLLAILPTQTRAQQITDEQLDSELGEMSFLTIKRKHMDHVASLLGLDETQKDGVLSLYKGYRAHVRLLYQPILDQQKIYEDLNKKYEARFAAGDETAHVEYQSDLEKVQFESIDYQQIQRDAFAAQDQLIEDVQLLMDDQQMERWDRVERWHRRILMDIEFVPMTWLTVDMVDVALTTGLDVVPESELEDMMLRYEKELDTSMVPVWNLIRKAMDLGGDEEPELAAQMEIMGEAIDLAKAIRDVNKRYAGSIERALPESEQVAFRTEVHRRAAPWVYRSSSTERAMDKALGFGGLTAQQIEDITALREKYMKEVAAANNTWRVAIEATEKELSIETMFMFGNEDESITNAIDVKRQIDRRFREQLEATLSSDDIAKLPGANPDEEYSQWFREPEETPVGEVVPAPTGGG